MNKKVLLVDDEEKVLSAIKMSLEDEYTVHVAHTGTTGLQKLKDNGPFAVVMSDLRMPSMDGVEFLRRVHAEFPDTIRIVLSGYADVKSAIELINKGQVFRFLTKPCSPSDIKSAIDAGVEQFRLLSLEKDLLHRTVRGVVEVLTDIMSLLDPIEFSLVPQKKELVAELCAHLGVRDPLNVVLATMLSSIGAPTIPNPVLLKIRTSDQLTAVDEEVLDQMCDLGANFLQKIPRLEAVASILRYQRYRAPGQGPGAPDVLPAEIPQGAKILKVVNDFFKAKDHGRSDLEALAALRPQKHFYDSEVFKTLEEIVCAGPEKRHVEPDPHPVSATDLLLGQILARDAKTVHGAVVAPARTVVGEPVLVKISNYAKLVGLNEPLYVYPARQQFKSLIHMSTGG